MPANLVVDIIGSFLWMAHLHSCSYEQSSCPYTNNFFTFFH